MKTPVGLFGMTDEERTEFFRTGKYPERIIEAPGNPPAFSLAGHDVGPANLPDFPASKNLGTAIRNYWRLDGKFEGRREGLDEGLEKGRLEGSEKGRQQGREEVLRENLTEALQAAKDAAAANSLPKTATAEKALGRRGRPPNVSAQDDKTMDEIERANPGLDDYRLLMKNALVQKDRSINPAKLNRRSKSAEERRKKRREAPAQ
jgi:hypothetical protein